MGVLIVVKQVSVKRRPVHCLWLLLGRIFSVPKEQKDHGTNETMALIWVELGDVKDVIY